MTIFAAFFGLFFQFILVLVVAGIIARAGRYFLGEFAWVTDIIAVLVFLGGLWNFLVGL